MAVEEKYPFSSQSKHHPIQTVFHELLVDGHELGGEGLEVVDGLAAQLQAVFVVGRHVGHLRLQLTIAVTQQLGYQTLLGGLDEKKMNNRDRKHHCKPFF